MNGPAVGDCPWLLGTNCGDAKCRRWSPWIKCGSHARSGGPSMAAALGPGEPIVGGPLVV